MLVPEPGQVIPKNPGSHSKVRFVCDCGNAFSTSWRLYTLQKTRTCGNCEYFRWKNSPKIQYGFLTLLSKKSEIRILSDKALWECSCGSTKYISVKSVLAGLTSSCGCRRNHESSSVNLQKARTSKEKLRETWLHEIPELINDSLPDAWTYGSGKVMRFRCKCGQNFSRKFCKYSSDRSTCGKCSDRPIKHGDKIGDFIYRGRDRKISGNSDTKELFECLCGKTTPIRIRQIFIGKQKRCSKCNLKSKEWWLKQKFGYLTVYDINEVSSLSFKSENIVRWKCKCGKTPLVRVCNVTEGLTKSCGECREYILVWFSKNQDCLKSLKTPITPSEFPREGPELLETINKLDHKYKFRCWLCERVYSTRPIDIIAGKSLSCGCVNGRISNANFEIQKFLEEFGVESILEYELDGMFYDLGIPSKKLVIEHQGLFWHSREKSESKDKKKFANAVENEWDFLSIYEDEWVKKPGVIKSLILNKLGILKRKSIRPSKCEIRKVTFARSSKFYEENHYIGKTSAQVHFGVFYTGELVACASFRKPSRQTIRQEWEISRMVCSDKFQIHGIWSKIFNLFVSEFSPNSVVSYSDSRLFSGKTYEKMGFFNDGNVKSDYYWVRGNKRSHKSGLRKENSLTESQFRISQGYRKIFDLGKIRWVWKQK